MRKSVHTPEYKRLLAELRQARNQVGLTQRDLGARLKVPHSWMAKVETGERRIDVVEFCCFMRACGVNPLEVFSRINECAGVRRVNGGRRR